MPEPITIPIATVDITMEYVRPNLLLLMDRIKVVDQLFERYGAWQIQVDDVEVITAGKPSEQGIKFTIPKLRTAFFFGPSQCRLTRDDADWESAEETIQILTIGVSTLADVAGTQIATYKTAISLHLQPKTAPFIELIKPFAAPQLATLEKSPLTAFATVVKWKGRRITIDGSAQIANGIFLKFEREFPGAMPVQEIAIQLRADEGELFALLKVEETRS
jgi:hypothetical protein